MSVKENLESKLHEAMRTKDEIARDTIRIVLSAIKLSEVETGEPLDDNRVFTILQKEIKIRNETINELKTTGRVDLIEKAQSELVILEKFLPSQLSDADIEVYAREVIAETSAKSLADMGKVMGILVPKLVGKAPPDRISQVVRKILAE